MATRTPKALNDYGAFTTLNNYLNNLINSGQFIDIVTNSNNPPTVKQGSRFEYYKLDTGYTIPVDVITNNNEYGPGDNIDYNINEAIFENSADVTFTWSGTTRGITLPAQSDGTWYLYCQGNYDVDETTIGQGKYTVDKTVPTFSHIKGGYFNDTYGLAIAQFTSTGGVVSDLIVLGKDIIKAEDSPSTLTFTPGKVGQIWLDTSNENVYFSVATVDENSWISAGGGSGVVEYDTGWINRSDWTNVHLGSNTTKNVDSNVSHNFGVPLSEIITKVLVSTDGTDATSFEVSLDKVYLQTSGLDLGLQYYQVDTNSSKIQTGQDGMSYYDDGGVLQQLTTQDWYYKVKAYTFENTTSSSSSTTSDIRYETGWINRSDWTSVSPGSTTTKNVDSNVSHNLGVEFKYLDVKFLVSTDGTDANAFELPLSVNSAATSYGGSVNAVDTNNLIIYLANSGITYIDNTFGQSLLDTEDWYYNVVVTKREEQPTVSRTAYDTGWINRSDWTNVHLGSDTTKNVDSNVSHNLGANLSRLLVRCLVSSDGTDNNAFEISFDKMYLQTSGLDLGVQYYQIDSNDMKVQTGQDGVPYFDDSGILQQLTTQDWYYKVVVVQLY
jgi:hypothetical protein